MDQQQAHVLRHLRVVLVQLVYVLDEAEATALLLGHHHPQRRQLWGRGEAGQGSFPAAPVAAGKWGEHGARSEPSAAGGTAEASCSRGSWVRFPIGGAKLVICAQLFPSGEGMGVLHGTPC